MSLSHTVTTAEAAPVAAENIALKNAVKKDPAKVSEIIQQIKKIGGSELCSQIMNDKNSFINKKPLLSYAIMMAVLKDSSYEKVVDLLIENNAQLNPEVCVIEQPIQQIQFKSLEPLRFDLYAKLLRCGAKPIPDSINYHSDLYRALMIEDPIFVKVLVEDCGFTPTSAWDGAEEYLATDAAYLISASDDKKYRDRYNTYRQNRITAFRVAVNSTGLISPLTQMVLAFCGFFSSSGAVTEHKTETKNNVSLQMRPS